MGSRFWTKHGLKLNLVTDNAKLWVYGRRIRGRVRREDGNGTELELVAAIRNADIDDAINDIDFTNFRPDENMQEQLRTVLWRQREVLKGIGRIKGVKHEIKLVPDAELICFPVRRRSLREEEIGRETMSKLLDMGVVKHVTSPWEACNVFVKKKDGSTRATSDFRGLNSETVTESHPMEEVGKTLEWMRGKRDFSTIDLQGGFFRIELDEKLKHYPAMRTVVRLLRYLRLPQGLKNSPAVFQRISTVVFGDRKGEDLWAFMDDVSLGTGSAEAHLQSLESVLERFLDAGARL